MATLKNKRKLSALNKKNCDEHPGSNLAQNSNDPKSQEKEDYITQVSKVIEGRVMKKLSKEFSRTESCILGALSRPDNFLLSPLIQDHSETAPETSLNAHGTNQETNDDESLSEPHPSASISQNETTQSSGPEETHDNGHSYVSDIFFSFGIEIILGVSDSKSFSYAALFNAFRAIKRWTCISTVTDFVGS